jgi:hypothetical protein
MAMADLAEWIKVVIYKNIGGCSMSEQIYPSARMSWSMVTLLTIAYVLSFVDRSIIGLLIEPIKADLDITDE